MPTKAEIESQREAVIKEAKDWLKTPFHHEGRVKGAGVDCAQYLIDVYFTVGLIPDIRPEHYDFQWAMHQSEEKYLDELMKHGFEVESPEQAGKAGVVIWKVGRNFSHAAIIMDWPMVIHAAVSQGVVITNVAITESVKNRERKFFTLWDENGNTKLMLKGAG
jgi:cell wall-associated NlpC family hydrolase